MNKRSILNCCIKFAVTQQLLVSLMMEMRQTPEVRQVAGHVVHAEDTLSEGGEELLKSADSLYFLHKLSNKLVTVLFTFYRRTIKSLQPVASLCGTLAAS